MHHGHATATKYTVQSGDTLSSIAGRFYQNTAYWPAIYWANHGQIRYANDIEAGQVLTIPAKSARIPRVPSSLAPAPAANTAPATATADSADGAAGTTQAPPTQTAPAQTAPAQAAPTSGGGTATAGSSAFQQCVISRESGGNSQAWNAGGYYGLYQFSASTWAEYGGNPADFGNASAAQQNQVFDNAMAAGGQSNWSAYDGC